MKLVLLLALAVVLFGEVLVVAVLYPVDNLTPRGVAVLQSAIAAVVFTFAAMTILIGV